MVNHREAAGSGVVAGEIPVPAVALGGVLLVVGVLLAAGALGGGSTPKVTTVKQAADTTPVADTTGGDTTAAEALYESTSPGVVEIKATISASSAGVREL